MSLHEDLLEQAKHLLELDTRRPKQASLRRAVSTAYYSLFHLLVEESSEMMVADEALRHLISRAFEHSEMLDASRGFASANPPDHIKNACPKPFSVPKDLREFAETFVDLQAARHKADYKLDHRLTKIEVQTLLDRVQRAFDQWRNVRSTPVARVYLASILFYRRWRRDST